MRASIDPVRRSSSNRRAEAALGALAVAAAVVVVAPAAAWAGANGQDGPGGTVSVSASGGGAVPGLPGWTGGEGPTTSSNGSWVCTATPLVLNDESLEAGGPVPGGWFSITCVDLVTGEMETQTEWISRASAGEAGPAIDPRALAVEAERSIVLPDPTLHFSPTGSAVVNLPTWLWVDSTIWHPISVSVSAGGVTATATADPRSVTWSMGDGSSVVCGGPGTPYNPSVPADDQTTNCAHTYLESSAGEPSPDGDPDDASFPVTATVDWTVSWSAVGAPGGGALPDLTTASTVPERVEQVESINTVSGGIGPSE